MLIANIQAQIEAKTAQLISTEDDILKINNLIKSLETNRNDLLNKRSDIIWKIEELKEELENG